MDRCLQELKSCFNRDSIEAITRDIVLLIRSIGGAASVFELGLPTDYQPVEHAEKFNPERLRNNPRRATPDDIVGILRQTFDHDGCAKA